MPAPCAHQHPPAEFLASHRESTALGVGQAKWTWAKLLPEDPILLPPEIIDHVFLVAVHPASGREYEDAQSVGHSAGALRLLGEQPRPRADLVSPIRQPRPLCCTIRGRPWWKSATFQVQGIVPLLARRGTVAHGSGVGQTRWILERMLVWLHRHRRLTVRYERSPVVHEAFLTRGCVSLSAGTSSSRCWSFKTHP